MAFKTIEQQILEEVIDRALANEWSICVNDGEEETVTRSRDRAQILEACQSTDADVLTFYRANLDKPDGTERIGWVWLIYGNGRDLISDYTANDDMDAFVESITEDIKKAF